MTLHSQCKEIFLTEGRKLEKEIYFTAMDAGCLKNLLKKLSFSFNTKNSRTPTEEEQLAGFKFLITNLPAWYRKNAFSIKTINSSYDNIINQIRSEYSNTKESRYQRAFSKIDKMFDDRK